jgi:hypothetical protein
MNDQMDSLVSLAGDDITSIQRLVVLAPQLDGGEAELAQRVWQLGSSGLHRVLYLALAENIREESSARRRLATLAALTRETQTQVETALSFEHDWLAAVNSVWHAGDLIVSPTRLLGREPASTLHLSVYTIATFGQRAAHRAARWMRYVLSALPYLVVIVCSALQFQIAQWPHTPAYYAALIGSVIIEAALVLWCVHLSD